MLGRLRVRNAYATGLAYWRQCWQASFPLVLKFTGKTLGTLLEDAGFAIEQTWTDPRQWYAVTLAGLR